MKLKLFIATIIFSSIFAWGSNLKGKFIKPQNSIGKILIQIGDKNFSYFPIMFNNISYLNVRGPGKIKVITRAQFANDAKEKISYKILYRVDGGEIKEEKFENITRSSIASYKDKKNGVPGENRNFIIDFGEADHSIEIWNEEKENKIAARFYFTKSPEKKIKWISISPLEPSEPVELITNENITMYYRFSEKEPLRVQIIGPTFIKLLTRVENHYDMKGRVNYRLQIKEGEKVLNTYLLNSSKSEVTSYKKDAVSIPGKAKKIVIPVPKGKHVYEITPLDKDKESLLGRLFFPKKDIHLEE